MAKVTFSSLKLKTNTDVKEVKIGEHIIEVKQYLSIENKNDLVEIALQKAEENGVYNEILLDMYFNLNIIYLYTNITFTDKQKEDEPKLYDVLESNGLIDSVVAALPQREYAELVGYVEQMKKNILKYKNTAGAVLQSIIQDLPKNAAIAKDIIDSFDPNKYQAVVDFATAANGGRNINTNKIVDFNTNKKEENNPPVE